ncbi:hypothetical protein PB2503_05782 [Parvularcula bermudensis HTCC2503]|uniref:Uncharacterized protein n=1 Tax=Parvularcula bermudensis (strain ATCC BAA-594 / HTCC2503 / KCTC 12087) TaxID=314260 RepID=E0TGY7_PARBH|nr:hypothetical protein [Parvularcula bermudensis]ADM09227.1 hypothetical protein PB2503_05782 [Parvularcula bermudensis HTCC2503]
MRYKKEAKKGGTRQRRGTQTDGKAERPIIEVDYDRYAAYLDEADLSEAQKREFLETLWNIIVGFIDLGFGVHPAQQARSPCGQLPENLPLSAKPAADQVKCPRTVLIENFEEAAEREIETMAGESS